MRDVSFLQSYTVNFYFFKHYNTFMEFAIRANILILTRIVDENQIIVLQNK